MTKGSRSKLIQSYVVSLLRYNRRNILLSLIITVFLGFSRGASLIMLLPVLGLAGITNTTDQSSRALELVAAVWKFFGVTPTLLSGLALYLLLVLAYAALNYVKTLLDTQIIERYKQNLRDDLFSAVIRAEWGFIKRSKNTPIFNNIITEVDVVGYAHQLVIASFGTGIIFLIYLTTSLYVSFKMTLIATLCFLPLIFAQKWFNKRAYRTGQEMYERHESLFNAVLEFINSFKLAKSYSLQDKYVTEFNDITRQTAGDNYNFSKIRAGTSMLYEVGSAVIICVILVWAIQVVDMPGVDLLLMIYIATKLLPNISTLTRNFQYLLNTLPSYLGVSKLLDEARENKEQNNGTISFTNFPQESIMFSGIQFSYEVDTPIFDNFNCTIPINKTTSITGESGKGKSTLIELLLGLLKPQKGKILLDTVDLNSFNLIEWRNSTAYIPQECFLFNSSIRQNLRWSKPDASEDELREALQSAAGEFVYNLPDGLETLVGDQGIRLSGGERQRIALARALLRKPKILILDEATNALDKENEALIKTAIKKLRGKTTVILISHDQIMGEEADHVIKVG